jgi:hypothetical protein
MSELQDQFLSDFNSKKRFTTKEIYDWYCTNKRNPHLVPYRNQIYPLIINPLLHNGRIAKLDYGIYCVVKMLLPTPEIEDEFSSYLNRKMKGGDK